MVKLCQSCFRHPALARTKKNKRLRIIPDHDLCKECERKYWDREREKVKENEQSNND